jgi:hypothetical protein
MQILKSIIIAKKCISVEETIGKTMVVREN